MQEWVDGGAGSHATAYIYAAFKQEQYFQFLSWFVQEWAEEALPGFDKGHNSPFKAGTQCFRCSALKNKATGGALLSCSLCRNIFYCSPECQKLDWKRHKEYSCVQGPKKK